VEHPNGSTLYSSGGSAVNRILKPAFFVLATLYFTVDAAFSYVVKPLGSWISGQRLLDGIRPWIVSLRPYPTLALFAVPVIILEPVKPIATYLMGTGQFTIGLVSLVSAEILKLTLVERLFEINRDKLMSIPAFAWAYGYWRHVMDWFEGMEAWQAARRWSRKTMQRLRSISWQWKALRKSRGLLPSRSLIAMPSDRAQVAANARGLVFRRL
jgi:hypothetical protein